MEVVETQACIVQHNRCVPSEQQKREVVRVLNELAQNCAWLETLTTTDNRGTVVQVAEVQVGSAQHSNCCDLQNNRSQRLFAFKRVGSGGGGEGVGGREGRGERGGGGSWREEGGAWWGLTRNVQSANRRSGQWRLSTRLQVLSLVTEVGDGWEC